VSQPIVYLPEDHEPDGWPSRLVAEDAYDALAIVATDAVSALVPVLPLTGSPKQGYVLSETGVRGSRAEIEAAALAVAALHEALR
jgi:hypothetical protein